MQNQKRVVNLQSRSERMGQKLRYGVMVALQILALSVRVRILLSQQNAFHGQNNNDGGIAQLVRAHDS